MSHLLVVTTILCDHKQNVKHKGNVVSNIRTGGYFMANKYFNGDSRATEIL